MKGLFILSGLLFGSLVSSAQQNSRVTEYKKTFPTYPFSDPNPVPSFTKIYPYFRYDGFTDKPVQKEWKVVELENDYLRIMILPEVGGKIWAAIEKSTGQPFIYYNHAVKFRDVAMRGPWTSGGIEANYGIIGHTPACATPVDYTTRINDDGSASCIIGVLDLLTRTSWRMEINLPRDKAYFTTRSFWHNATPLEQPYYHWMNTGLKASGDLEFIYPGTTYLGHNGEYSDWPVNKTNGKKISFYNQNNFGGYKSYHVFGKYTGFFGGYWHDEDFGMVRYAAHDDKAGKKIWIWGLSRQGMIWEKLLTDTDGQYVEVQSGRLFNQNAEKSTATPFKHRSFAPYATDEWTEYWYPVLRTKGFVEANEYGALNLTYEGGWLKLYFSPVQSLTDTLQVRQDDKIIYRKAVSLAPLKIFSDSLKAGMDPERLTVTLGGNKLLYNSQPSANTISRPMQSPNDFDWNRTYGLYVQGKEFMDQRMYAEAEEKLAASLSKDANFLPALVKTAELLYRNGRYDEALQLAKRALSVDTHDGGANYYYGLLNAQLKNTVDAKDGFDLATLSTEYRSAAYTELSRLYLKEKNWVKAVSYATKAIDFNRYDIVAYEVQAIAYRRLNDKANAAQILHTILAFDPLNHFARFENYLAKPSEETETAFVSLIRNEQPQETFLELATLYFNDGCLAEAENVLQLAPSNSIIEYWLAFLLYKQGKSFSAALEKAARASPAFAFPFRSETAEMLQWAAAQGEDWKPDYYLALLYKSRNRVVESKALFNALANRPDYAPFYAARAELEKSANEAQRLNDLLKALALDKSEWRYHKSLTEYYIEQRQYKKALAGAEAFYRDHPQQYITGMLYAKTLLLNGRYRDCDKLLSGINIIPFEGATDGRELFREAKLMQAVAQMRKKNYGAALKLIDGARTWPENLGVGKPYEDDVDERLEDWMSYCCYQKTQGRKDAPALLLQKIVRFSPRIENTVSNFIAANDLVTAWAMKELGKGEDASRWLDQQIAQYPDKKILLWCKDVFETDKIIHPGSNEQDGSAHTIEQLMLLTSPQ